MSEDESADIVTGIVGERSATPSIHNVFQTLSLPRVATTFWGLCSISLHAPKVWQHTAMMCTKWHMT